jgi:hypothetical protein
MKPSPIELAKSRSYVTPFVRSYLDMAEYREEWIDLEEGSIKGGIFEKLMLLF